MRQFNDTVRAVYASTPTALRAAVRTARAAVTPSAVTPSAGIPLRLAHRGPYHCAAVFDLLHRQAVAGVEEMSGPVGSRTCRRTLRLPHGTGIAGVGEFGGGRTGRAGRAADVHPGGWLDARLYLTDLRDLTTAVQRLRRLFDLDADPYAVDERLSVDPRLAPLIRARPGLRAPGAADREEYAIRALVGQAEAERLVRAYGKVLDAPCGSLTRLFPEPAVLAEAEPEGPLGALAAALADGAVRLDAGADRDDVQEALLALPDLDAGVVAEIRARALGDPDVAPPGVDAPDTWRPWRTYAAHHLRTAEER